MLRCLNMIVIVGVVIKSADCYSYYPGIFDPNPYIPKMHPDVLRITSSALHDPIYVYGSSGGTQDSEAGYVKSNSEKGTGGYHHVETFQKKDGNDYDYEYQTGHGESKDDEDYEDRKEPTVQKRGSDGARDVGNYEVIEEHGNDHKNPDQHMTYGVKPTKASKKPTVPEFGTRLTLPKKTTLKKNHNGYETVVYHGHENESSEKGYDWRNHHNPAPKAVTESQKDAEDEEQEEEEEHADDEKDNQEDDYDKDSGQSNFGDNYDGFKYDNDFHDFSKNFNDEDEQNRSEEGESVKGNRGGSGKNNYDYDEEVENEEVDEAANEDRYQGGDYDDDNDYGKNNRRHYQYASEADYEE